MTAIEQLRKAIDDAGRYPLFHEKVMKKHRFEWPALWAAIDRLVKEDNAI